MAASGYTPISLYYSTTASAAPTSGNLVAGELALNTLDEKLYFKNSSGTVKLLASNAASSGTVSSVAMSVPAFLSVAGSPVTTSGTLAVTYSGTALPVANGGTNATSASITSFNNITGYTASGATGTTSTNLVFSTSPTITTATLVTPNITTGLTLTGSAGTSGQALLSAGSGAAPTWGTAGITTGKSIAMAMIFGF